MESKMRMKKRRMNKKKSHMDKQMYKNKRVKRQIHTPGLLQMLFGVAYTDNVEKVN